MTDTPRGPGVRASHADRRAAADIVAAALRDGRLDAAEHGALSREVENARYRQELDDLLAGLPTRLGVREWADELRVRAADRQLAVLWLGEALAEQRFTAEEYERRIRAVAEATHYAALVRELDGVPGPAGTRRDDLLVTGGDREAVLDRLTRSAADGLVTERERDRLDAAVRRAERYRDLDAIVVAPRERVGPDERMRAIRRLDAAHDEGRLDDGEHATRVRAARAATRDAELAGLLADLPDGAVRRPGAARLSEVDRRRTVQELQQALADGRLDLDEYDARVRTVYGAKVFGELEPVLGDLLDGTQRPLAPVPRPRPPEHRVAPRRPPFTIAGTVPPREVPAGVGLVPSREAPPREAAPRETPPREAPPGAATYGTVARVGTPRPVGPPEPPPEGRSGPLVPRSTTLRWSVAARGGAPGLGSWLVARSVALVRTHGALGHALDDGRLMWTYQVPAGCAVEAASPVARMGVGLVTYRRAGTSGTTMAALDVTTGTPLWERPAPALFAVADDTAVVPADGELVAVGLLDGQERWRVPVGPDVLALAASPERVLVVHLDGEDPGMVRVRALDPASGRDRLRATLPAPRTVAVLGVDPVALWTDDAVILLDPTGGWRASVPRVRDGLELVPGTRTGGRPWRAAMTTRAVVVHGDTLIAPARLGVAADPTHLTAHRTLDGAPLWTVDLGEEIAAVQVTPDDPTGARIVVQTTAHVIVVSRRDGSVLDTIWLGANADLLSPGTDGHEFRVLADGYLVVNEVPGVPSLLALACR